MAKLFTAEQKDRVINSFAQRCAEKGKVYFAVNSEKLGQELGISAALAEALLHDFVRLDLINLELTTRHEWWVQVKVALFDLSNTGGFVAREKLAEIELHKLTLELEALEKTISPVKFERIMSSIQALTSVIALFKS